MLKRGKKETRGGNIYLKKKGKKVGGVLGGWLPSIVNRKAAALDITHDDDDDRGSAIANKTSSGWWGGGWSEIKIKTKPMKLQRGCTQTRTHARLVHSIYDPIAHSSTKPPTVIELLIHFRILIGSVFSLTLILLKTIKVFLRVTRTHFSPLFLKKEKKNQVQGEKKTKIFN